MTRTYRGVRIALVYLAAVSPCLAAQQQVTLETPVQRYGSSYYEHFNVGWRLQRQFPRGSMFFEFNRPALPPWGGYDPNADARWGAAQRWGNGGLSFQFTAGQGSTRTMTMSAPSVTTMNGMPASFQDTTIRPFVTGLIPVVGGFQMFPVPSFSSPAPVVISPLAGKIETIKSQLPNGQFPKRRRAERNAGDPGRAQADGVEVPVFAPATRPSSAERGDVSVAEIRQQQAAEDEANQQEIDRLCAEARIAEVAGRLAVARVRYQQAAARTKGTQREKLLAAAARLKPSGEESP